MSTPKNLLIFALVAAVAGLGVLVWKQRRTLQDLEAQHAALLAQERAEFKKRLASADRDRGSLERELAESRQRQIAAESRPGGVARVDGPPNRPGPRGSMGEPFNMMENPQMQKFMASQQRSGLDGRYAALFKKLKLSPADLEKLKSLLIDKQTVPMDVMAAARAAGMNPRQNQDDFNTLMRSSMAEIDASIQSTLGEAGFAQYSDYEKTQAQRMVANLLEQRLSYSDSPLSDSQTEQLIRILAETTPQGAFPASGSGAVANLVTALPGAAGSATFFTAAPSIAMAMGGSPLITNEAIARASGILSPSQLQALTELQQQQQAQAAMMESMRKQVPNVSGNGMFITREAVTTLPLPAANVPAPARPPGGG